LLNKKNHIPYTDKIGINVLQLNHIEEATEEDVTNNLVYWAKLFKAGTWEEFKALAKGNPVIEEVGNMIFELNTDDSTKHVLEGQRRYKEMIASQYVAGYTDAEEKLNPIIAAKDAEIADKDNALAEKDNALAEKDNTIAEKDALLKKYLERFGSLED
jgi:hypothetical protein